MGKTENGAIWLDKNLLSAYDYWQFWRNTDDRDVIRFLNMFTNLSTKKIESIKDNNINELKILLANETTSMLHGEKEAKSSENTAKEVFSDNSKGINLPAVKIKFLDIKQGINILDLIILSKLENSKSEVRRLIKGKAIKINNEIILDEKLIISKKLFQNNFLKLSIGKKRHIKIEIA